MADSTAAIQIERLGYWYDARKIILNDINLKIAENECIAIAGQNGSGKTTLLKNISGLLRPSTGNIFLRGKETRKMGVAQIAGEIGFVMQESGRQLFEPTVYDEVAFALKRKKLPKNEIQSRAEEALDAVGLLDKRNEFPLALNRADRVKTVFAAVLAMGAQIIMLDEPLAGQDLRGCRMIMDIIARLNRQNHTIIMVTHNISAAAEYAQRIIVMQDSGVYMDGPPAEIFARAEELAAARILPPPITRLSLALKKHIPLEKPALTPAALANMLVSLKH